MATEQQIPKLAGLLVEHQSGFSALSVEEAQWVIGETKQAIALFCEAVRHRATPAAVKLLELVTSVSVSGWERFVAADHFKHGETVDGVKVFLGDNFRKQFLGKVEENVSGCDIRIHKLLRDSRDLGIRAEIGEGCEETYLAHLWGLLKLQSKGEDGVLLTSGRANIFYICDVVGTLWAVCAYWRGGDWGLSASSVVSPREWDADYCVCSR